MIFRYNFYVLRISTSYIFQIDDNFNRIQFQQARVARPRKNKLQFQRCNNFYILGDDISLQFLHAKNFYFLYFQIDGNFNDVGISTF